MEYEEQHTGTRALLVSVEDYELLRRQFDETQMRETYIGRWATREAFGQHLLADTSAERELQTLPRWLRPLVQLSGEALVQELEEAGLYVVANLSRGVAIFDGAVRARPQRGGHDGA